jgi:hypothetical protein
MNIDAMVKRVTLKKLLARKLRVEDLVNRVETLVTSKPVIYSISQSLALSPAYCLYSSIMQGRCQP